MNTNFLARILFAFTLILTTSFSYAQERLWGTWRAACPALYEARATIRYCDLCPHQLDETRTRLCVSDFDLIIGQTTLTITKENVSHSMIPYSWDNEKHIISFEFRDKKFNLRAHYDLGDIILMNDDGTIVVLRDKKTVVVPVEK